MVEVTFKNQDMSVDVEVGTKLITAIRKAGLELETPCNGRGKCGKCKVEVEGDLAPPSREEMRFIAGEEKIRLACLARIKGDVEISLTETQQELQSIQDDYYTSTEVDSRVQTISLTPANKDSSNPLAEMTNYNPQNLATYQQLGSLESKRLTAEELTGVVYDQQLLDVRTEIDDILGVAIDIGTTGLTLILVNLQTGTVINQISGLNSQVELGGDVLSRITYCMEEEEGLALLQQKIIKQINELISQLVGNDFANHDLYYLTCAGNTTMLHLLAGVNPASIARTPYRSIFLDSLDLQAPELGIKINPQGRITLLPSASSYIGADIVAGLTAIDFSTEEATLFIDIGTNGEIVVKVGEEIAATSTAAGPALEGVNISCGSRAQPGAVETCNLDDELNLSYSTIGGEQAKSICGSGLIDLVANLVQQNIISKTGRFNQELSSQLDGRLEDKTFYLTEDVYLTQQDIRQLQLAKGAIATGINMLLEELATSISEIDKIVIAGGFGYHLNINSLQIIGLIPAKFEGEVSFVGNTSARGAQEALINQQRLDEMEKLQQEIKVVELSTKPEFQDRFIQQLNF
ncbi:MAG: ASKHA domain-containing protein [Bacillota bacterium]